MWVMFMFGISRLVGAWARILIFYIWNVHNKIGDLYVFSAGLVGEAVTHIST